MIENKEDIFGASDWDTTDVEIPKWGTLRIRALSAQERLDLLKDYGDGKISNENAVRFFCKLITMSCIKLDGSPLFDSEEDQPRLAQKSWGRLEQVANEVMKFNGMNAAAQQELEKN